MYKNAYEPEMDLKLCQRMIQRFVECKESKFKKKNIFWCEF